MTLSPNLNNLERDKFTDDGGGNTAVRVLPTPSKGTGGSGTTGTVSTETQLTPPAGAIGFILTNLDTSTANIRWAIGRTAGPSGPQLQPGRDTNFIPCAATISICAESGTQNYDIQWVTQ